MIFKFPAQNKRPALPPDLHTAHRLLMAALCGCLLIAVLLTAHCLLQTQTRQRSAVRWMQRLDLSMPAIRPSGTLWRMPEAGSSAVDLRLTPLDLDLEDHITVFSLRLKDPPRKDLP